MDIVFMQESGREYRRHGIHNGNLVRTVFSNYGVVAQPKDDGPRGAWVHDNNGYIGDVSLIVGAEVTTLDTAGNPVTFHSVVVCPVDRPVLDNEYEKSQITGKLWGFEPVRGYFYEGQEYVAMSTNPNSWPPYWPDAPSGWGNEWNGFYGKDVQLIQQESYFVMNDNNDEEFNDANNNVHNVAFKPDSTNLALNGLGLEVKVRGMQWGQFMAQDVLFWLYEVTNKSTTDYSKIAFGELVGTYVGVTSTEDREEYDDDWSFFDVNQDLTYTGDFDNDCSRNPNWVGEVGMVGYAFLESPGNPFDGIDNDGDASDFGSAPLFEEADFDSSLVSVGDVVILIDDEYNRTEYTISESDSELITRGGTISLTPGLTYLKEGNIWEDESGKEWVNPNAYDGIDNDLDGLIDENYFVHYIQRRLDPDDPNGPPLFNILNPRAYKDYFTKSGLGNTMIDEMRDNGIDDDNDWNMEFDDVGADGIADSDDTGEGDGVATAGEPNFDQTDPDESDQIGLTSFDYFTPAGDFPHRDDEALWDKLAPGFFDVPSSIENGEATGGEDGDFIFGSGYFPLRAGQTERFSIALIYGENKQDLLKNKKTVQDIYDQDYRFSPPPAKPTLTAVPGDGKVTLYWDRKAEEEKDPILKKLDFQGYKIYKATDSNFNDVRNVTNADGIVEGYQPLEQFDLADTVSGYFYPNEELFQDSQGFTYNLGSNSGLVHQYVDEDVLNGRTYYYALVAYDTGDTSNGLFPTENSKFIQILPSGEIITDQNTAVVIPSSFAAGYVLDTTIVIEAGKNTVATGSITATIVDETQLTGHVYRVEFLDTSMDSIDNDNDTLLLDMNDLDEYPPITTFYSVFDTTGIDEFFEPEDSLPVFFSHQNILPESFYIENSIGVEIPPEDYEIDFEKGKIWSSSPSSLGSEILSVSYQYYPIYKSPYINDSPWVSETDDNEVFDGITLQFNNAWTIVPDTNITLITTNTSGVTQENGDSISLVCAIPDDIFDSYKAAQLPNDYMIVFSDDPEFGHSVNFPNTNEIITTTNFRIYDTTHDLEVNYFYNDPNFDHQINQNEVLYFIEENDNDAPFFSGYSAFENIAQSIIFGSGDTLFINITKPFRYGDEYYFTTPLPHVDESSATLQLDEIRVVPNPYIAATTFESPLPPGITSGRGERKVNFQNLPADSKVKIYTARGQHIRTLDHDGSLHSGTISWDLKTKENLDVAYGVYFYVVESEFGSKQGKLALIK